MNACWLGKHDWQPWSFGPGVRHVNHNARCRRCGKAGQHFRRTAPHPADLTPVPATDTEGQDLSSAVNADGAAQ